MYLSCSDRCCVVQQEAVALLESREGEGDAPEGGGDEPELGENEEEAQDAARALLGLPGVAEGAGTTLAVQSFSVAT